MKLGILDAVPPQFAHVDDNITDAEKFIDLLTDVNIQAELCVYNAGAGQLPATLEECDAYLITGSPVGVYDPDPWIPPLLDFIRVAHAQQTPLVGICFGHQAIAQALGGQVMESPQGWLLGLEQFELLAAPPWLGEDTTPCKIYHINKDQVVQLPAYAQRLGQSEACPNSMYSVGEHILCIQGHPEQPLRAMKNFIADLGAAVPPTVVENALKSFESAEPDRLRVGEWIRAFFEQQVRQ